MLLSETTEISDLVWFYNARQWTRIVGGTPLPPAAFNMHGEAWHLPPLWIFLRKFVDPTHGERRTRVL
jgi:hypothetical protein